MNSSKLRTMLRSFSLLVLAVLTVLGCGQGAPGGTNEEVTDVVNSALTSVALHIACGGKASGVFVADTDFSGGSAVTVSSATPAADEYSPIANFAPDAVYHTARSGSSTYTLPGFAPGSRNVIRLHFIEEQKTAKGQRLFNVVINGLQVLTNFDIFVSAGGVNRRDVREFTMGANLNGQYVIQFGASVDQPIVSAIEAVPSALPPPTQIACGQAAIGPFADDYGFSTGSAAKTRTNPIFNQGVLHTGPAAMYDSQRYGSSFSYTVPGFAAGSTNTVRLHFAETHWSTANARLFNVTINGVQVLTKFDVFAAAGAMNTAVVREFRSVADSSGNYTISFLASLDAATISGIEILPMVSWFAETGMTSAVYQSEFNARVANGYRLTYVDGYTVNGTTEFSAIWDLTPSPAFAASHNLSPTDLATQDASWIAAGYHIKMLNGYEVGSSTLYAAIWEQGVLPSRFQHHGLTHAQYQTDFNTQLAAGLKLVHVSGFESGGTDNYAAIWDVRNNSNAWSAVNNVPDGSLALTIANAEAGGSHVIDMSSYNVGGSLFHAVTFEQSAGPPTTILHNLGGPDYRQQQIDLYRQGYTPLVVNGAAPALLSETYSAVFQNNVYQEPELEAIRTQVSSLMFPTPTEAGTQQAAASVSLALTNNGRLVFASATGLSNPAGVTTSPPPPLSTDSLYRIASVSKTVTAAAIMKLVDMGRLNIDALVFGAANGGILGDTYAPYGPGMTGITVRQLLSHSSGLCNDTPPKGQSACPVEGQIFDTTTLNLGMTPLIQETTKQGLPFPPGTTGYSNMGYLILGRVVEALTTHDASPSPTYSQWALANLLGQIGAGDMAQSLSKGNTTAANDPRVGTEVTYEQPGAYSLYNVNRMDAHGGWLATAPDLVKLAAHIDGQPAVSCLLSPLSSLMMSTSTAATVISPNFFYTLGWQQEAPTNYWKNGFVVGMESWLFVSGPLTMSILANSGVVDEDPDLRPPARTIMGAGIHWPSSLDFSIAQ